MRGFASVLFAPPRFGYVRLGIKISQELELKCVLFLFCILYFEKLHLLGGKERRCVVDNQPWALTFQSHVRNDIGEIPTRQ